MIQIRTKHIGRKNIKIIEDLEDLKLNKHIVKYIKLIHKKKDKISKKGAHGGLIIRPNTYVNVSLKRYSSLRSITTYIIFGWSG